MAAFSSLAWLALRYRANAIPPVPMPAPKRPPWRPKKPDPHWWELPPPKKRGAPEKFTPKVEQWFLAEIEAWRARFAATGTKCFGTDALRVSIAANYFKRRQAHRLLDEATRVAEWVTAINRIRAQVDAGSGRRITVSRALFFYTVKLFEDEQLADGLAPDEARRRAKAQALELQRSPVFRRRKEHLSRLRSAARQKPR